MRVPSIESESPSLVEIAARSTDALAPWQSDVLAKLLEWFGVEFHLIDGDSGEPIHCSFDETACDWGARGLLCREVARRGQAEFIEDEEPLLRLAIPLRGPRNQSIVAVGTFVTSYLAPQSQVERAARALGLEAEDAAQWIGHQACWTPDILMRMGRLAREQISSREQIRALGNEVHHLSAHLSNSYDEIALLYQLTQNLRLSSNDRELAEAAIAWLSDVVPAQTLAVLLTPPSSAPASTPPTLLAHGECPLDAYEVRALVDSLDMQSRPLVANRAVTTAPDWHWPEVRELIVVPLAEGDRCFGWLLAINHALDGEFGTVEASLLSSVGVILGIHSGNTELYQQQREFFAGMVRALTSAIDAKDPYTCGHSDRVARVAVRLAEEMGCNQHEIDTIYLSGLLHDVGKIGIDDNVLRKPGKLTPAEYEHIKTHAEIGHRILSDIKQLDEVLPVVLHHHEQWDGKGYPHGLAGEAIPFLARIVAVADSFDAMGSDRPYRPGIADEKLDAILREGAGAQWDAEVVTAFFKARDEIREISHENVKALKLDVPEWN
jgi:hypothetical protein